MRKSRIADEQIIAILQESAAGGKTGELIRRHGISRATFYKWRRKYGGLQPDEAKRLRGLEEENRRLKRVVEMRSAPLASPTASGAITSVEWACEELNLGPHAYQACALTT